MSLQRGLATILLVGVSLSIFLSTTTPVFAVGSCECSIDNTDLPEGTVHTFCTENINTEPACLALQQLPKKTCEFTPLPACELVPKCGDTYCQKSSKVCSEDRDCTQYSGVGYCVKSICYLDSVGFLEASKTPGVTAAFGNTVNLRSPSLTIRIPGVNFTDIKSTIDPDGFIHLPWIGEYIAGIYKFLLGAASIIAVFMIISNGARVVISAGGEGQSEAYHRIGQVVIGLVILWGSYLMLYTINPDLTKFQALKIQYIKPDPLPEEPTVDTLTNTLAQPTNDGYCVDQSTLATITNIPHVRASAEINMVSKNLIPLITQAGAIAANTVDPATKKKFDGLKIVSAVRTLTKQNNLYAQALEKYGSEEAARSHVGKPQGCGLGSNHLAGQAVDLHLVLDGVELKSDQMTEERINLLQDIIMTPAGWVRYCPEWWHFEAAGTNNTKPLRSTKCDRPYGTGNAKLKT